MSHADPADEATLAQHRDIFDLVAAHMGFVPNSMKIMARRPEILNGFLALSSSVLGPTTKLDPAIKQLTAYAASLSAGCIYCQAHTSHGAERAGVSAEKLARAWNYLDDDDFAGRERAAMSFAQKAASVPNDAEAADYDLLRQHFDEDEIIELVAVVSLFGFLNRWNDTLATTLEDVPKGFAGTNLLASGWTEGKHGQ